MIPRIAVIIGCLVAIAGPLTAFAAQQATPSFDPAAFAFNTELVEDGLDQPVYVTQPDDGSGRLFIVEQPGRIKIVGQETPFLDIADLVGCCGERGLLSVAFHPDYRDNGYLYVNYTDKEGDTRIVRYTAAADDPNRADPATAQTLLTLEQPASNHNGGLNLFGPDGYLYIGLGDGGGGNGQNGQALDTLLGKLLRIDVDRTEGELPYAIPPDNPFVGQADVRPEIFAYGLRNPWRFSFDRQTGDLWIGDVGAGTYEEVDLIPAGTSGQNFGWDDMEGDDCRADDCSSFVAPVGGYSHDIGCVVTGGYVYRGAALPALTGVYLYADYCGGQVWGAVPDGSGGLTLGGPIETGMRISSFGEDVAGELYLVDLSGAVYRIVS
jgi:glucose/arabinose dehydrogenase